METVCRLCVSKPQIYVDVYDNEGKSLKLVEKIAQCLQIWLYPEDPLPKTVCALCIQKVNDTFEFFETCSKAQSTLHTLFNVPLVKRVPEITISPDKASVENRVEEDETSIKMEPGLDVLTNFIQENTRNRLQVPTDVRLGGELKTSSLQAHPEELLECLLDNSENNVGGPAVVQDVSKTHDGPESSVKRKGRTSAKQSAKQDALEKQNKKEISAKTNKRVISPVPSRENSASDESENDEDRHADDTKMSNDVPSADWTGEENASEIEILNNKSKNTSTPKKASGTKILEDYPWQCVVCDSMVQSLQDLKSHYEKVHGQAPVFKCMQCSKVYNRYRSFSRHVKLHHNPKKFSCDICGKSFAQKTVLQSHSAVHSEERPFSCDQCGKRFKQFSSLYLHNKNHLPSSEREKFRCEHCDKEFASKHTLETHRKVHTGERNFICDICGKSFIAKGSLDYHILSHTGDKPHNCSVCGKCFKTARLLTKHVTLHSGIKPHQCDVCGKQFREKGALREHSRIHTGAMPYACDYCGKRFRFKGILTVHTRQHTGERPYACLDCPRQFTNWANYNKHMKRRHRNADGSELTYTTSASDSARRTLQPLQPLQPHPLGLSVAAGLAVPLSSAASSNGLILQVPSYSSNGLPSVLSTNMTLLDSSGSSLIMPSQQIQGGKILSHGSLCHLGQTDLPPGQLLSTTFCRDPLAKDEDDGSSEGEEDPDEDPSQGNHVDHDGQSLGSLANTIEDHLEVELTDGTLNSGANNQLQRQLFVQDNSNSSNNMTVPSAFPPNYSNNSHAKMAVMFQSHHSNKMTSMFYQDGACDSANQSNSSLNTNTGSYHMNPYMPSGISSSLPSSLPSGLATMGSMGYYVQPLHGDHAVNAHQSHNMHISHNRISNNQ